MKRQPSPEQRAERREDEGRMSLFVTALALVAMVAVASAIAYYLNTTPWAEAVREMMR
jgi:hypothetical protein